MKKESAGILVYKKKDKDLKVFLVHMGGPFWSKKDKGAWTIPKGEVGDGENLLDTAVREFEEETGFTLSGDFFELTPIRQKSGKIVHAWALEADLDPGAIQSNSFEIEWPPKSGKTKKFPEVDKAEWFGVREAKDKIIQAQYGLIEELQKRVE